MNGSLPAGERRASLRDGSVVRIRPMRAEDEAALEGFLRGLAPESRRLRFFTAAADTGIAAHLAVAVPQGSSALLAFDEHGQLVGHAMLARLAERRGEFAVEVADRLHGQGLGTLLLELLAEQAEREGIETISAEVLPENRAMLELFEEGFDAGSALRDGVEVVEFPVSAWRLARKRFGAMQERPRA